VPIRSRSPALFEAVGYATAVEIGVLALRELVSWWFVVVFPRLATVTRTENDRLGRHAESL